MHYTLKVLLTLQNGVIHESKAKLGTSHAGKAALKDSRDVKSISMKWASSRENLSSEFPTKLVSNQSPQL